MALGIKRETMGDIVIQGKRAYLFCLDSIAPYITGQLEEVRRTRVKAIVVEPETIEPPEPPKETSVNVQSARLSQQCTSSHEARPRSSSSVSWCL